MAKDSEFRTYIYIEKVLADLGWDTRNPARSAGAGAVYTQGEFRNHNALLTKALGRKTPENIILIPWEEGPRYWVVEAKRTHQDKVKALHEAQAYADAINEVEPGAARFATGIAGTPEQSFYVTTSYWDGREWQEAKINDHETTGFLTLNQCQSILNENNPSILHYDVDLGHFLSKANKINESLHKNGIPARDRARLVAGLLLALAEDSAMRISNEPSTLVNDINGRISALLTDHKKKNFITEVSLKLPNTRENHRKYWAAIIQTMQYLREMNIRSAINSGTDALGQFYETFLKYANDASEMGIVLTPRHITRFAAEVMNIQHDDLIFDPTCGTGGFLVAALDHIRIKAKTQGAHPDVYKAFRNDCLFGIEQDDGVFGLALVNMIFRGDGKSHIHNGNCFDSRFVLDKGNVVRLKKNEEAGTPVSRPFSRVLMNPPFAIAEKEHKFVDYALEQTRVGGLLFAVLPNNPITGGAQDQNWREEILKRHTVRAVIKLPGDLFMPVSKGTYALILEAWRPHELKDKVFFSVLYDDNSASKKSKLLGKDQARENMDRITKDLSRFLTDGRARINPIPREVGISKLNMESTLDFAPEAYLDSGRPAEIEKPLDGLCTALFNHQYSAKNFRVEQPDKTQIYKIDDLFVVRRGNCPAVKNLSKGNIPVITTSEQLNGIEGVL